MTPISSTFARDNVGKVVRKHVHYSPTSIIVIIVEAVYNFVMRARTRDALKVNE